MSVQELQKPASPESDVDSLLLPSVPQNVPLIREDKSKINLPDIRSINITPSNREPIAAAARAAAKTIQKSTSPFDATRYSITPGPVQDVKASQRGSPLTSLIFPAVPSIAPRSTANVAESDGTGQGDAASVMSLDDASQRAPSVSMDDPDVRIAAEALSGLGNPDFARTPSRMSVSIPQTRRDSPVQSQVEPINQDVEPLLSLITTSHPWLGGAINSSFLAYSCTKSHSPRFIQYGADLLERNIGTPVAHTVSTVGRRYLGNRRPSDIERGEGADSITTKRRRVQDDAVEKSEEGMRMWSPSLVGVGSRRQSMNSLETLPPYEDNALPEYEEQNKHVTRARSVSWSTQLMITTSGLGVALSETSLRSLRFCLGLIRNATSHLGNVMEALRIVLDEYDRAMRGTESPRLFERGHGDDIKKEEYDVTNGDKAHIKEALKQRRARESRRLAERMQTLGNDILQILKTVVNNVSRYAGGALPDNASALVRRQLLSVPYRWHAASQSAAGTPMIQNGSESEPVRAANRMLAFAKEGLDMMGQVSLVVDATIVSAERWLDSMGKGKQTGDEKAAAQDHVRMTKREEAGVAAVESDAVMADAPAP